MSRKVLLKDISKVTSGSTAPKENHFSDSGKPFIRAGHLEDLINGLDVNDLPKVESNYTKNLKITEKNSILFAKSGMSCKKNRVYKTNKEAYFVNHLACITSDEKLVNSDFLKYYLQWYKPSNLIRDESYPSIRMSDISNIEIDLPNMRIQKKIATVLNKTNALINLRAEQIDALSSLKQSIFLDMFGDPVTNVKGFRKKTLNDLSERILGGGTPSKKNPEYYIGNIPWITPKDMKFQYVTSSIDYINNKAIENSSAKYIPENSVLMVIRSGILKHSLPVAINKTEVAINQDMKAFIPKKELLTPEYLLYSLKCFEPVLLSQVRSVTAHNLEFNKVKKLEIPIPEINKQISFSKKVKRIEDMIVSLNQQLKRFEELSKSLSEKAFNGELFQKESTIPTI